MPRLTLFRQIVRERHWTFESFSIQFCRAAEEVARADRDQRIADLTVSRRSFNRWMEGALKRLPWPDTCRVLEHLLQCPAAELFAPPSVPAASNQGQESIPARYDGQDVSSRPRDPYEMSVGAAAESLEFAELVTRGNVSEDTLEHLAFEVSRIATDYVHAPLFPLFGDLTSLRDGIFSLLKGRQRPRQTRELFLLAGVTCLLLSHASQNLGAPGPAMTQVRTAWTCAEQADHTGLRAWVRGTAALIAEWSPQNRMALKLTEHGAALAPAGESRIRIAAIEARTAARIGDRERALAAVERMGRAREEEPEHDEVEQFGGLLSFPVAKQEYYLGGTYTLLGHYNEAERHASKAVEHYITGPSEERSYGDEALALVDIATARLAEGDVSGAAQRLRPILALPPELRIQQIGKAMIRVAAFLQRPALAGNVQARELADLARGYGNPDRESRIPSA